MLSYYSYSAIAGAADAAQALSCGVRLSGRSQTRFVCVVSFLYSSAAAAFAAQAARACGRSIVVRRVQVREYVVWQVSVPVKAHECDYDIRDIEDILLLD